MKTFIAKNVRPKEAFSPHLTGLKEMIRAWRQAQQVKLMASSGVRR